jgi:hypothetical protein
MLQMSLQSDAARRVRFENSSVKTTALISITDHSMMSSGVMSSGFIARAQDEPRSRPAAGDRHLERVDDELAQDVRSASPLTRFGRLTWPHFGRLIWPHPRPTATRPFRLSGAGVGGRRGDGIESGAVRADSA